MDAGGDTYEGATSKDLIGSAFYAYSTELLVRAGEALGRDVSFYKKLHERVVSAFRDRFMKDGLPLEHTPPEGSRGTVRTGMTQTGIALILRFGLCTEAEKPRLIDRLAELVHDFGDRMSTGFLGTPHLLHALSENGRTELAYRLLFNEENPSWLYSVNHGATTIWEHWNGIKEDGSLWSVDMNSFNHYAYGAVGDWLYGVAAGICPKAPGYQRVTLAPKPHRGLGRVDCSVETPLGTLESHWCCEGDEIRFSFVIPCGMEATVLLPNGEEHPVAAGTHSFAIKE
jgi:alpha-L-rhamnosidase